MFVNFHTLVVGEPPDGGATLTPVEVCLENKCRGVGRLLFSLQNSWDFPTINCLSAFVPLWFKKRFLKHKDTKTQRNYSTMARSAGLANRVLNAAWRLSGGSGAYSHKLS